MRNASDEALLEWWTHVNRSFEISELVLIENQFQGVKLDNRMERDADIMRKKQEAAAAKKAAEEAAARAEKNKKLQVFDPLK